MTRTTEVSTFMKASPADIYKTLLDFDSYPAWNPLFLTISGNCEVGQQLDILIKLGEKEPRTFKPVVTKKVQDEELRWVGALYAKFLYRGEHYFILAPADGGTMFTHGETGSGLLTSIFSHIVGEDPQNSFQEFNDVLKNRVEK